MVRDRLDDEIPGHGVKELRDIEVDNPVVLEAPFPAHRDRIQRPPSGTVGIGVVVEQRVHDRLQHHHGHSLSNSVSDVRYAQDSRPPRLRYFHHPNRPCPSSILLDLQPGIPHEHFRDVVRLALQPRLTHAAHSPRVDRIHQPGRPIPLAPPALPGFPATTRRSASVPRDRYSAPHGFSRSGSSLSPPVGVTSGRYLHTFHTRAWTGLMLPICRTPPGQ